MMKALKTFSVVAVFFLAFVALSQGAVAGGVDIKKALGEAGITSTGGMSRLLTNTIDA